MHQELHSEICIDLDIENISRLSFAVLKVGDATGLSKCDLEIPLRPTSAGAKHRG
jgi:hypothetical protein